MLSKKKDSGLNDGIAGKYVKRDTPPMLRPYHQPVKPPAAQRRGGGRNPATYIPHQSANTLAFGNRPQLPPLGPRIDAGSQNSGDVPVSTGSGGGAGGGATDRLTYSPVSQRQTSQQPPAPPTSNPNSLNSASSVSVSQPTQTAVVDSKPKIDSQPSSNLNVPQTSHTGLVTGSSSSVSTQGSGKTTPSSGYSSEQSRQEYPHFQMGFQQQQQDSRAQPGFSSLHEDEGGRGQALDTYNSELGTTYDENYQIQQYHQEIRNQYAPQSSIQPTFSSAQSETHPAITTISTNPILHPPTCA